MIYYLLLLLSIALTVSKSALCNAYAKHAEPTRASTFSFNAVAYGAAALIAAISLSAWRNVPPILGMRFDMYAAISVCGVMG